MKRCIPLACIWLMGLFAMNFLGCSGGGTSTSTGGTGTSGPGISSTTKINDPYNIAPTVDCSAWMSNIPAVEKATLSALTLPGTHDAGAYTFKNIIAPTPEGKIFVDGACDAEDPIFGGKLVGSLITANAAADASRVKGRDFGLTQHLNILDQLRSGIRYLDLRVAYSGDGFYFHHGLLGESIPKILSDVRSFVENDAGPKEVVILDMSHFYENTLSYKLRIEEIGLFDSDKDEKNVFYGRRVCGETISKDMSPEHHNQLIDLIESNLDPFLYRNSGKNADLQNMRIGDIAQTGPKIVVLYPKPENEGDYNYPDFLWNGLKYNAPGDDYPNSDKLSKLQTFSQSYVDNYLISGDQRLLEVQWLLTAKGDVINDSIICHLLGILDFICDLAPPPYNSVHDLSNIANPELSNFIYKPNQAKTNIMRVDFSNESPAVDIALDSPVAVCRDVTAAANEICVADASVDDGSSDNKGEVILSQAPPGPYPLGETTVTLTASDGQLRSSCGAVVSVIDNTGPIIKKLKATPDSLWPPNHRMVPISIQLTVADNCDPKPACKIVQVRSNEPEGQGGGAGNFEPDWVIQGDLGLELRAERSGNNDGRRYDVTVECTDKFQNSTHGSFSVEIPHSASK